MMASEEGNFDGFQVPIRNSIFVVCATLCVWILWQTYAARRQIAKLRAQGLPVAPGWSWLTGNLLLMAKIFKELPPNAHKTLAFSEVLRVNFPAEGCCYLDLWPFSYPFLMVMSPDLATQATQTLNAITCERPPRLDTFFKPLAGGPNLFDLPEQEWRPWRAIFNKGFSTDQIASFIPSMVDEVAKYRSSLRALAKSGEIVLMDTITLRFAMDFIGRTTLNVSLRAQDGYNVLADSMLAQARLQMHNREGKQMDVYIGKVLDDRFEKYKGGEITEGSSKSIMDLVLEAYLKEGNSKTEGALDPQFRTFAINQVRLFLFVGHDSMSSTICYATYLLSSSPSALAKLRQEFRDVLGLDSESISSVILEQPNLLNSLPFTTAVIKETLRLFPPGSGIRQGHPSAPFISKDGMQLPTDNMIVWIMHTAMHRVPEYWVEPDAFLPERFLVGPGHRLYPQKGAWRPFEWGPRNCIGQSLAMAELKIALAVIVSEFDFAPAYDEWDRKLGRKGERKYRGERAYQIEEAAAHPADRMPTRISFAER